MALKHISQMKHAMHFCSPKALRFGVVPLFVIPPMLLAGVGIGDIPHHCVLVATVMIGTRLITAPVTRPLAAMWSSTIRGLVLR
jgi:hypothetical protein